MISRVAESCYWMQRYVERSASTARLIGVNRFTVLDAEIHDAERWRPVVVVAGEEEHFIETCGEAAFNDDDVAEDYLTWNETNPISINSSIFWARENARTIREVISREMWETINEFWQWMRGSDGALEYRDNRAGFYRRIERMAAQFQGAGHNTMLHEEPFDFMRLGMLIERANQTARIVDVKHHWLGGEGEVTEMESPNESAQWAALLRFCSATEAFFKRARRAPTGPRVAEFLLKDGAFPGSVWHCLDRSRNFLERIHHSCGSASQPRAMKTLAPMIERLHSTPMSSIFEDGIHAELTRIINNVAKVGELIHAEYFDPGPERLSAA